MRLKYDRVRKTLQASQIDLLHLDVTSAALTPCTYACLSPVPFYKLFMPALVKSPGGNAHKLA